MSLGSRLRDARIAAQLSRADLATRLGVKPKSIENWELNASEPSLKMLKALCKEIGLPLPELLDELDDEGAELTPTSRASARMLEARRHLERAARLLGGTVTFGPRQPSEPTERPEDIEVEREPSALDALTATARDKGFRSRLIPKQLAAVRQELSERDYPELVEAASQLGIDLLGLPDPNDDLEGDELVSATAQIESFILADAIYADHWRALSIEGFERAADEMKAGLYKDDPELSGGFINRKSWSEDADQYAVRLRREITPHLLIAVERGKPVDLAKLAAPSKKPS